MGAIAGALKEAGNQNLVSFQDGSADRAYTVAVAAKTVNTAFDVHEAVFPAVQRRKRRGAYQLAGPQFCRADWAGLGLSGGAFASGFKGLFAVTSAAKPAKGWNAYGEKKGIAKPKQDNTYKHKN